MILIINPITVWVAIILNTILIGIFIYNIQKERNLEKPQLKSQLLYIFTVLFHFSYVILNLKQAQKAKLWEFDSNKNILYIKQTQIFVEFLFKMSVFVSFIITLSGFQKLSSFGLKDMFLVKRALISYVFVRFIILYLILNNLNVDYNLYMIVNESYCVAESLLIIFISGYFLYLCRFFNNEIKDNFIIDHYSLKNFIECTSFASKGYISGFVAEIVFRIGFLYLNNFKETLFLSLLFDLFLVLRLFAHFITLFCAQKTFFFEQRIGDENLIELKKILNNKNDVFFETYSSVYENTNEESINESDK
ncbi:hypothetical protein NUSPORA_02152 [Nucleospora cyclopteri]